MIGHFDI